MAQHVHQQLTRLTPPFRVPDRHPACGRQDRIDITMLLHIQQNASAASFSASDRYAAGARLE